MTMNKIRDINRVYLEKAEKEQYKDDKTLDICIVTNELIHLDPMIGTEADALTWGEFTRRFNVKMRELMQLLEA